MSRNTKAIAGTIGALAVLGTGVYFFDQSVAVPRNAVTPVAATATAPSEATAPAASPLSNGVTEVAGGLTASAPDGGVGITGQTDPSELPQTSAPTSLANAGGAEGAPQVEVAPTGAPQVATDGVALSDPAPSIDTFFRNPDETTIIAGRATPGQTVAIMLGGEELDRVVTAADGTFGAVVFITASDLPRRLRLIGDPDGQALASAASVIVPPSAPLAVAEALSRPNAAPEIAQADTVDGDALIIDDEASRIAVGIIPDGAVAPDVGGDAPAAPTLDIGGQPEIGAAPTLLADADGVRVIQPAEGSTGRPQAVNNIALDAITYDPAGEVILTGRAPTGGFVQIYLDNQPITTSRITEQGDWSTDLPEVDTGVYTLRVDELDAEGNVQSRIETPFKREQRETVAAIMADQTSEDGFDLAVKTVQPGNTLWAIAEERFGEGIMYVAVFEANKDQIRDPDLIYPGQVFQIPELSESPTE